MHARIRLPHKPRAQWNFTRTQPRRPFCRNRINHSGSEDVRKTRNYPALILDCRGGEASLKAYHCCALWKQILQVLVQHCLAWTALSCAIIVDGSNFVVLLLNGCSALCRTDCVSSHVCFEERPALQTHVNAAIRQTNNRFSIEICTFSAQRGLRHHPGFLSKASQL